MHRRPATLAVRLIPILLLSLASRSPAPESLQLPEGQCLADIFDANRYATLQADQVTELDGIVARYCQWREIYLPVILPDPPAVYVQNAGVLPAAAEGFPKEFIAALVPVEANGVTTYPVVVYEDAKTREHVFVSAKGKRIAAVRPEKDYDPQSFVRGLYPDLDRRDAAERAWLVAMFDPARIAVRFDLIFPEDLAKVVLRDSILAARAAQAAQFAPPGGMMMGGPVENIQFTAISRATNGVRVTISYPDGYTNRLDIFTCEGGTRLMDFWWELGVTTNVSLSTNWIAWTDASWSNSYQAATFYAAANADADSDSDGFGDGRERFMYHTDPTNSASKPVSVAGTISYTGSLSGPVRMIAVTSSNSWLGCMATMSGLGAYTNAKVANGATYWFKAYRDCNWSKSREYGEPWGVYTNSGILATNNLTGINITLTDDTDEDDDGLPDWWELQYFPSIWSQDGDDDNDSDSLANSSELSYGTNPANADTDNDRLNDYAEIVTYGTSATNGDTDCDNMGDGTEVDNGASPSSSNAFYRLPFTEGFETNAAHAGMINNQNGWIAWPTNKAVIVTSNIHSGQQAVALLEAFEIVNAHHLFGGHGITNVWVDCWLKFNPTNTARYCGTPDLSDAPAWQPCFFAVNDRKQIVAYHGDGTNGIWRTSTNVTVTSGYHRYTVRQDYLSKTWAMYFDGTNIFSELGFRDRAIVEFSRFSLSAAWNHDTWIDDLSIVTNQPSGLTQ